MGWRSSFALITLAVSFAATAGCNRKDMNKMNQCELAGVRNGKARAPTRPKDDYVEVNRDAPGGNHAIGRWEGECFSGQPDGTWFLIDNATDRIIRKVHYKFGVEVEQPHE